MNSNRPEKLSEYIGKVSDENDSLIAKALIKLEDKQNWAKISATVSSLCKITGLSRNTIRNRDWALKRLKDIKRNRKANLEKKEGDPTEHETEISKIETLRKRVRNILEQNALLYDEIIELKKQIQNLTATIKRKDIELNFHKNNRGR